MPAGKPEAGFAAVNALNRYMSGEPPDNPYVTLNVEARKNFRILAGTDGHRKRCAEAASCPDAGELVVCVGCPGNPSIRVAAACRAVAG